MSIERYKPILEKEAGKLGVSPAVHPEDLIFQFILNHPNYQSKPESAIEYYFQDGYSSTQNLSHILKSICQFNGDQRIKLFEFASGYGCVTRHIKNVIPFAETSACDIHPQAMQFINENFKTATVLSSVQPEDLILDQKFDVVFALSFFSHMPKTSFSRWQKKLASLLNPGGYLIFTTQGIEGSKFFPDCQFDAYGFYFKRSSEQFDLDAAQYGTACTLPTYVIGQIFHEPNWELIFFQQGYWWGIQDVYVVKCLNKSVNTIREKASYGLRRTVFGRRLLNGRRFIWRKLKL